MRITSQFKLVLMTCLEDIAINVRKSVLFRNNFKAVSRDHTKTIVSFQRFNYTPWSLHENCLFFCVLSNETNFEMIS